MNQKLFALTLLGATACTVAILPDSTRVWAAVSNPGSAVQQPANPSPVAITSPKIEVVFVVDTTGSMGGLLQAAKEKIWSIATTMGSAQNAPDIKLGLVAFRDRGDQYITKTVDLSADLDSIYASLMDFRAAGGGDGPESVNQALHEAVTNMSWSQDSNAYKVVFLVGDAPPHMDYQDDVKYPVTMKLAKQRGIVVNTIQCGQNRQATGRWQQIAQLGNGEYFQVDQAGSAVAIATPYDEKLAALSKKMDDSRIYYGTGERKARQRAKVVATDKLHAESSVASQARRATFNVSASGRDNSFGDGDLVADIAAGRIELSAVPPAAMPTPMQTMKPAEQRAIIERTQREREALNREIKQLAEKRADYLKEEVAAKGGARDSLDAKVFRAVRAQTASKGLRYESEAPTY